MKGLFFSSFCYDPACPCRCRELSRVFRFGVLLVTGAARCVRMKWNHVGALMPVCNCMVVYLARRISGKLIHLEENAE
jgi:hypothetical protein